MNATDLLQAAYRLAMANGSDLHGKWVQLSHQMAGIAGVNHLSALQQNSRLDLLLRQLERERVERMRATPTNEVDWSLDVQVSLSQTWVLKAYEVVRVVNAHVGKSNAKVAKLAHRLALVRMPIAKGEIEGMHVKRNQANPPMLVIRGETETHAYSNDGSYIMPSDLCGETGAALWYPVDIQTRETVAISRRDLSDEMLALFD